MKSKLIASIIGATLQFHAFASAACPGAAFWCEDFEHGGGHVRAQAGTANHILLVPGDGRAILLPEADTAVHNARAYYVEARLRPLPGAGRGARQGYVIARYVDARNWLGFGLNLSPDSQRVGVDIVKMQDGKLKRIKQAGADIDAPDSFYTVRLDLDGTALTLYVNGNRVTATDEPALPPGRIGVLAQGSDFEFDDLRIGDSQVAPQRIGLVGMNNRLSLQANDGPQRYLVRAATRRWPYATRLVAASSAPAVLDASIDDDTLVLTPHQPGKATVTVASAGDNNVALAIGADVGPAFAVSARTYSLQGRAQPFANADDVPVDTLLRLRLDQPAVLAASGSVRIVRASDDAVVDVLRIGNDVDAIGTSRDGVRRVVRFDPIQVDGATLTIHPHDARLAYDTEYYVLVDANLLPGATLGGAAFTGIGKAAGWRFRTRSRMPTGRVLTVDDDGPADFRTVQGALDHAMRTLPRAAPVTIRIANGRYDNLLYLRGKDNVTLLGESRDGVVIAARNSDGLNPGAGAGQAESAPGASGGRSVFLVEDADQLRLDKLTIINTTWRAKPLGGQAEALNFASDGRLVALDANFVSEQDTILVRGWSWFYHSLIAGNVDFIWGYNHAALFEEDEIRSVGDSAGAAKGGYIVQARTQDRDDPGFVFLNSRITHGPGPAGNDVPPASTTLARPGTMSTWDKVSYINCRIGEHIAAKGWSGQPRGGVGWYEYNSMDMDGKPLDLSRRGGGRVLNAEQAAPFSQRARVFAGFDHGAGWNPQPGQAE
jgi:pectin methylesterase-like acyl-CoA thioesterase